MPQKPRGKQPGKKGLPRSPTSFDDPSGIERLRQEIWEAARKRVAEEDARRASSYVKPGYSWKQPEKKPIARKEPKKPSERGTEHRRVQHQWRTMFLQMQKIRALEEEMEEVEKRLTEARKRKPKTQGHGEGAALEREMTQLKGANTRILWDINHFRQRHGLPLFTPEDIESRYRKWQAHQPRKKGTDLPPQPKPVETRTQSIREEKKAPPSAPASAKPVSIPNAENMREEAERARREEAKNKRALDHTRRNLTRLLRGRVGALQKKELQDLRKKGPPKPPIHFSPRKKKAPAMSAEERARRIANSEERAKRIHEASQRLKDEWNPRIHVLPPRKKQAARRLLDYLIYLIRRQIDSEFRGDRASPKSHDPTIERVRKQLQTEVEGIPPT